MTDDKALYDRLWRVLPDRGDGWHEIGYEEIRVSRSGEIVDKTGVFEVRATACGRSLAVHVASIIAETAGERLLDQTDADLRHPMFAMNLEDE